MKIYPIVRLSAFLIVVGSIFSGCATGKKRFEKGDYDAATMQAIKRLRSNPDSKKARKYLPLAYEHAVDYHLDRISQLKNSNDRFFNDDVAAHYDQLNNLYNEIITCPECIRIVKKPKIFQTEYNEASLAASKVHFEAGLEQLNIGTKESGRDAYRHFILAKQFTPKYAQIDKYIYDALMQGTIHVLVEDIPVHSRSLSLTNQFFQNKIYEYVQSLNYNFVRFYREGELEHAGIEPDQVIVMQFDDFVVGQTYIKERVESITRDSVEVGTVETSEGKKPVYGTVKAELTSYEKVLTSSGLLDFQIVDAQTGATLHQRKLPGTYVWRTDWATYQGQSEALSNEQLAKTKRKEAFPPSPQDLFIAFTQPIYSQVIGSIRQYYRVYN